MADGFTKSLDRQSPQRMRTSFCSSAFFVGRRHCVPGPGVAESAPWKSREKRTDLEPGQQPYEPAR